MLDFSDGDKVPRIPPAASNTTPPLA